MTRTEYLLVKLNEECLEVGQRVTKALTFGLDEVQGGQVYTNAQRILHEYADLVGVLDMLRAENVIPPWGVIDDFVERVDAKKKKVEHYFKYSVECGTVQE